MENYSSSLVNLSIPKEVTNPIVAAKIQEAVLAALGGTEKIIGGIIHQICNTKVDSNGKASTSSYDNTTWMDFHVNTIMKTAIQSALKEQLEVAQSTIKDELIKQLQTKKGASKMAEALLSAMTGTFSSTWKSNIEVKFVENK